MVLLVGSKLSISAGQEREKRPCYSRCKHEITPAALMSIYPTVISCCLSVRGLLLKPMGLDGR